MASDKKINAARSLRQRETGLEHRLWQRLRGRRITGLKFRRQHPIGPYIADFACPEAKLVIEIDGYWHTKRQAQDEQRTARLHTFGYEVVRFETNDAGADIGLLVQAIIYAVQQRILDLDQR